jgi:secretion/DNA translocation related TadE-like protein
VVRADSGDDRGSGTVLVLTVVALAAALSAVGAAVGQAVVARHRAESAADLAALAAVTGAPGGSAPSCDLAAAFAVRNGARLFGCVVRADGSVAVEVLVDVQGPLRPVPVARGRARAGRPPVPADPMAPGD